RSILLRKPTLQMEHGGGEKFQANSRAYRLLKQWLEDGTPEPNAKDATVNQIEVFPTGRVMSSGDAQQLAVTAVSSDGRREDVTYTAQVDTLNDAVASVTPNGLVTAKATGETHIMIRFGGQAAISSITLPYQRIEKYPAVPTNNFIDTLLVKKWKDL